MNDLIHTPKFGAFAAIPSCASSPCRIMKQQGLQAAVAVGGEEVEVEEEGGVEAEYLQQNESSCISLSLPQLKQNQNLSHQPLFSKTPSTHRTRDFDLNAGIDENTEKVSSAPISDSDAAPPTAAAVVAEPSEVANSEYPGWSVSEIDKMDIDPHLAQVNSRLDEDYDEDYDEE